MAARYIEVLQIHKLSWRTKRSDADVDVATVESQEIVSNA